MQKPETGWFAGSVDRALGPLACPEYRRLLLRLYVLLVRANLLYATATVAEPFITPGLLRLLKRWQAGLKADVAAFKATLRTRNIPNWAPEAAPAPPSAVPREYQNPWA